MPSTTTLRQIKDLPGPRAWPLVGNAFQVNLASVHLDFERWAREFGPLSQMLQSSIVN